LQKLDRFIPGCLISFDANQYVLEAKGKRHYCCSSSCAHSSRGKASILLSWFLVDPAFSHESDSILRLEPKGYPGNQSTQQWRGPVGPSRSIDEDNPEVTGW
ncbi:hypothetical protein H1C71_041727, partial [Ictidomys tridecemlineatus]